ncbi:hypothetical protein [Paradevosia shaoguanensis]|uniref:Uncharacterized protein n=1 Tax=Paradevosia shaoguanensis TaxID=1335043 RepID=A0AA41UCK0_9HYPH|nr:hypothetical protein [Paradevosia shaoguanensis]MCF1744230.1 hypothetical protein [Paradevosia shaoguanensis]MCI0128713.1 hypothetical protein [Paradevosia shaoguanensis]
MANTQYRNYPLPDVTRTIAEEFFALQEQTLVMIDTDVHGLMEAITNLAPIEHGHEMSEIVGLVDALASKMPANKTFKVADLADVIGADEASDRYVLVKVGEQWIAQSALSALSDHYHELDEINGLADALKERLAASANLLDVADKVVARTNLGLGSIATRNITVSNAQPSGGVDGDIWIVV